MKKKIDSFISFNEILLNLIAIINIFLIIMVGSKNDGDFIHFTFIYSKFIVVLLSLGFFLRWHKANYHFKRLLNSFFDLCFIGLTFIPGELSKLLFFLYIIGRQIVFVMKILANRSFTKDIYRRLSQNPSFFFFLSFIFTILVGSLLLLLPISTNSPEGISFIDALFTSTSATCVTGLAVVSTSGFFSQFGQIVILFLIQIGGLGIMTISTAFAILLGQKLTLRNENLMQNVVGEESRLDMFFLVKSILIATLVIEAFGAIILYITFKGDNTINPIYNSIFHSVSAFCNAGFSLYDNSFERYISNFNINVTISLLIILGGIGFSVLLDIYKNIFLSYNPERLSAHSKIVILTTLFLIVFGFFIYFFTEYNASMKGFSTGDRIYSSFFQSVTTRTAGFNTIPNGKLSDPSILVTLLLMFIGASPGSTGGGIKTTTFTVIILTVFSLINGEKNVHAFRRRISIDTIKRTLALIAIAVIVLIGAVIMLIMTKPADISSKQIIFEAISAFGTVGLSMGVTSSLTIINKLVIIILMLLGRVGPLTLIFALSKNKKSADIIYSEAKLGIG